MNNDFYWKELVTQVKHKDKVIFLMNISKSFKKYNATKSITQSTYLSTVSTDLPTDRQTESIAFLFTWI